MGADINPNIYHYIFAKSWLISNLTGGTVGLIGFVVYFLPFFKSSQTLYELFVMFLVACASFLLGVIFSCWTIWPLLHLIASEINGAPYGGGEIVRILTSRNNQRGKIYEIWDKRQQIVVQLLEDKQKIVLSDIEVLRISNN